MGSEYLLRVEWSVVAPGRLVKKEREAEAEGR